MIKNIGCIIDYNGKHYSEVYECNGIKYFSDGNVINDFDIISSNGNFIPNTSVGDFEIAKPSRPYAYKTYNDYLVNSAIWLKVVSNIVLIFIVSLFVISLYGLLMNYSYSRIEYLLSISSHETNNELVQQIKDDNIDDIYSYFNY